MRNRLLVLISFFLLQLFTATAHAIDDDIEILFESGRYPEFFKLAIGLAQQGDANAQFLLGKAYHLGRGVETSPGQALHFYQLAAIQNNAKAHHNLGVMALDDERWPNSYLAIEYFLQALGLGLKSPTIYNLGRAYKAQCDQLMSLNVCDLAGKKFVLAWQLSASDESLDSAIVSFVTACMIARRSYSGDEAATYCKQATEWAEKGAIKELARATYNRGAIDFDAKNYSGSLPWFHLAYERGLGLAAYQLGIIYEDGLGVNIDHAIALSWFKRGAVLKHDLAIERLQKYLLAEMSASFDSLRINAAMHEWRELLPEHVIPIHAHYRLNLIKTLSGNILLFPSYAKRQIAPNLCMREEIFEFSEWRIFSVTTPDDTQEIASRLKLIATGMAGKNNCIKLSKLAQKNLLKAFADGATPMLSWPGQRRLLSVFEDTTGHLSFQSMISIYY